MSGLPTGGYDVSPPASLEQRMGLGGVLCVSVCPNPIVTGKVRGTSASGRTSQQCLALIVEAGKPSAGGRGKPRSLGRPREKGVTWKPERLL